MEGIKFGQVMLEKEFKYTLTLRAGYLAPVSFGEEEPEIDPERFEECKERLIKELQKVVSLWQGCYLDNFLDLARKARDTFE